MNELEQLRAENEALRRQLDSAHSVLDEWMAKTEWLQKEESHARNLGKHRADVMTDEIRKLRQQLAARAPDVSPAFAWHQGYRAGINDERTSEANIGIAGFGAKVEPARQNPYAAAPQPVEQPEQPAPAGQWEPVAWNSLSEEDYSTIWDDCNDFQQCIERTEAVLKAKNTHPQPERVALSVEDIQKWQGDHDVVMKTKAYNALLKLVGIKGAQQ